MMFVACLRLTLAMPENDSLKGKRAVVRRLRDRVRQRFPVAVAEVETHDDRRRITIGVACVSNDAAHGHAVLMSIRDFVEDLALDAELRDVETEVVQAF
ncbi:MAG: DUF503 domain-containing protein [Chloroflexi bacterium]|nr:DUF503 domain-containing protein [Chloroflexota bacterium]